jgi:large subunit ribosomal protein L9
MKIILKENIENLGKRGDVIDVADGYGRNYLIPRKLALQVTPSNMKMVEMEQKALRKKLEQEVQSFQGLIEQLGQTSLTFERKAGDKDVIFGSVSATDIKEALEKQGIEIEKKKILLAEPIKRLGNYTVTVKVFHDERADVKVEVKKEGAEEEEKEPAASEEKASEEKREETPQDEAEVKKDTAEEDAGEKEEVSEAEQGDIPEKKLEETEEEDEEETKES